MKMKKLFAALLAIAMFSVMALPAFADANSDYLAAVKAYQNQIAAREEAYAAAVKTYQAQSAAKAKPSLPPARLPISSSWPPTMPSWRPPMPPTRRS